LRKVNFHANEAEQRGSLSRTIDRPVAEGKAMEYVIHPPGTPARQRRLRDIVA
jgi:hypothetical protein